MKIQTLLAGLALLCAMLPAQLSAQSGALEINQLCVATGCFDGDSPGYPVELTQEGKVYRLTSDLVQTANQDVLGVAASNITVDLAGFTIRGPVDCIGFPTQRPCQNDTGGGDGIALIGGNNQQSVWIKNGQISGVYQDCIGLLSTNRRVDALRIEDMTFRDCGGTAIFIRGQSIIRNVFIYQVGDSGVASSLSTALLFDSRIEGAGVAGVSNVLCRDVLIQFSDSGGVCADL